MRCLPCLMNVMFGSGALHSAFGVAPCSGRWRGVAGFSVLVIYRAGLFSVLWAEAAVVLGWVALWCIANYEYAHGTCIYLLEGAILF